MLINTKHEIEDKYLLRTPVYLITQDLETARFYHSLVSATSRLGFFVENKIAELIPYPVVSYSENLQNDTVIFKEQIHGLKPDYILVKDNTIHIIEQKLNLINHGIKAVTGEQQRYLKFKSCLQQAHTNFDVRLYIVDFFAEVGPALKTSLYGNSDFTTLTGRELCDMLSVSYEEVMKTLHSSAMTNQQFIEHYKSTKTGERVTLE